MFSTREYLAKKTGPNGVGRASYLQSLVSEYQDTDSDEAKQQVLANLANFAYDPINFKIIRQLNIIDLFLDCLTPEEGSSSSAELTEFALAGLCNCAPDPANRDCILREGGARLIMSCLSNDRIETVINAMTALYYIAPPGARGPHGRGKFVPPAHPKGVEFPSLLVIDAMLRFAQSRNPRISNLAKVYLSDCCSEVEIGEAKRVQQLAQLSSN